MDKNPKSTQKTVTIDEGLWYELDEWLNTDNAVKWGFHSKAQFVNEAVRAQLIKYSNIEFLEKMKKDFQKKSQSELMKSFKNYLDEIHKDLT